MNHPGFIISVHAFWLFNFAMCHVIQVFYRQSSSLLKPSGFQTFQRNINARLIITGFCKFLGPSKFEIYNCFSKF